MNSQSDPMIFDELKLPGLYMLWRNSFLPKLPELALPPGSHARTYREGDDADVVNLLSVDGEIMTNEVWRDYKDKLLPDGLFLIHHTDTNRLVATAGAVHNPNPGRYYFPFGGELGYLIVHPEHRKQGLGQVISWMVVQRFLSAGYKSIRVCVKGFRLAAIKTYLKIGFVPFLYQKDLYLRWERICQQINWNYEPDRWLLKLEDIDNE